MTGVTKAIQVGLLSLLLGLFCFTGVAYARGGCFGAGTSILTSEGYKPIESLSLADHLVGLNLPENHLEVEDIGAIQVAQTPDYYLINGTTQVTGSHPFYVQKGKGLELVEVQDLEMGDDLIGENDSQIQIVSIQHIKTPLTIYNLLEITPAHNFYANGILVHNKGGGGAGGGSSISSAGGGHGVVTLNEKTLPGFMLTLLMLVLGLIPFAFLKEIYNSIRFRNKIFSHDSNLIKFTTSINKNFKNTYSIRYSKGNENWAQVHPLQELNTAEYQEFLDRDELIDSVSQLFMKYQDDWARKNFDGMLEYIDQPFYTTQEKTFLDDFDGNFDIVYQPKLDAVVPLSFSQQEDSYVFDFQINAEVINFELSPKGYILRGKPHSRSFTEYWKIRIDSAKQCYLIDINQLHDLPDVVD